MGARSVIIQRSLKEQVYGHLRAQMQKGKLAAGSVIDMDKTCRRLGVSKTPLREALLQLEMEGFVTILPRRGVVVKGLSGRDIRDYYEVIGALEAAALDSAYASLSAPVLKSMEALIAGMSRSINRDDFNGYYEKNLKFHDAYLNRSGNETLARVVRNLKKRLYDFPRPERFVKEWEVASIGEHRQLVRLLRAGRRREALRLVRDVHWSYDVQAPYIRRYYPQPGTGKPDEGREKPSRRRHRS